MEVLALACVTLAGAVLAGQLDKSLPRPGRIAAGFGLGTLGTAVLLFVLLAARVPVHAAAAMPVALSLAYLLCRAPALARRLWMARRQVRRLPGRPSLPSGHRLIEAVCTAGPLAGAAVLLAGAGRLALYWPISNTDALRLFDGRARMILAAGSLEGAAALAYDPVHFASYPPLTTLLYTWVYALGGAGRNPQYLSTLYTAAMAVLLYSLLSRQTYRPVAALGTLGFVLNRQVLEYATSAYTVALAIFYTAGAVLMACTYLASREMRPPPWQRLLLVGLFLGGALWARSGMEPVGLPLAPLVLVFARPARPAGAVAVLLPCILLAASWPAYAQARLVSIPPHESAALILGEERNAPPAELLTAARYLSRLSPQELIALVDGERATAFARQFVPLLWETDPAALVLLAATTILAWPPRQPFLWAAFAAIASSAAAGFFVLFLVYPASLEDTPDSVLRLFLVAVPLLLYGAALNSQCVIHRLAQAAGYAWKHGR